ncbi:MAG: PAS domain S-box protein, partial [Desulfobacteraceae bacterium]|nr:PAS domain S-box protein [Desulfobacteraceae bacterium]
MNPRTQAMITIGLVITILTLFFLFVFIRQQRQVLSDTIHNEQQSLEKQMNLLREQTAQRYKSRIKSLVTSRKQLVEAFAKKDRAELLKQAGPLLELFKNENLYFKGFFFANPDNIIFFRVPRPEFYGDDVTHISPLIQEGNRVKKMVAGFEIIKHGLNYRILHPVFWEQKYIGLVGFSIDADFFLDKLHKKSPGHLHEHGQTITDIALVFPKAELRKTVFLDKTYKIIGDYVIFPKGNSHFQKLQDHIDLGQGIQRVRLHDVSHALIHSAKFINFKGDVLADVLALVDIDTFVQGLKQAIVQTIIVACSLLSLAFVILYLNFSLLFKKITTLNNSLEQTNKELEHRVEERTSELKESEERLKAILGANPDPVVVYDVNGYPLYLNSAFTEIFGWNLNELQGRRIPFVPKDQQKITVLKIKEIYKFGNPVRFETKRLAKHGKTIHVLLSAAIIKDSHGINTGLVVNLTDVTERKKIEGQLRQSKKMDAIGTLAGGIAHDFNNILAGIYGYAQLTEMSLENPDKARRNIDQ